MPLNRACALSLATFWPLKARVKLQLFSFSSFYYSKVISEVSFKDFILLASQWLSKCDPQTRSMASAEDWLEIQGPAEWHVG